ncbi:hypothetical protein OH77DRAFT_1392286 [Trametes cingulata]|nr:hypothetical protein OH77DRAFT_1392286 [Trametes cingulata]
MPIATLNPDILALIASYVPRITIAAMMQVGRVFYHECPKVLLRDGASLEDDENIVKFVRFIRAEDGTRARYLTTLDLSFTEGDVISDDSAQLLAECLRSLSFETLRGLSIAAAEETFRAHPCLLAALQTLTTVQDLAVDECGPLSCTLVKALAPGMHAITLAYDNDADTDAVPVEQVHPLVLLQGSRDTLKTVELTFMSRPLPRSLYPEPYPNVHEFWIGWCSYTDLSPYIHAFPNLQSLTFDATYDEMDLHGLEPLVQQRLPNRKAQLEHGSWKALATVCGAVGDLYVSGLTCPVQLLALVMKDETHEMLRDVLNDTRPSVLSLRSGRAGALDAATGLPAVFAALGAGNMKVLKLDLDIPPEDRDTDVSAGLGNLLSSLKGMALQSLELTFTCFELPECMSGERFGMESVLPLCPVERYLEDVDVDALGRQCLAEVPTLENAQIMIRGHRTRRHGTAVVKRANPQQD